MEKTESEVKFEGYREYLRQECVRLASYIRLYRRLHECRADRLDEMNLAPAFFQLVMDALFVAIVLWVDKLFSKESERGIMNFLTFCEQNRKMFGIEELQRRRDYPDGHWMLKRDPITFQTIQEDKGNIDKQESLHSFGLLRDKRYAHFDKEYFFDRERLFQDAPLKWSDLEEIVQTMRNIINRYSAAYDGNLYELEPIDVADVDHLLDHLRESKRRDR